MLQALFNQFDTDNSGVITKANIISAFEKRSHSITKEELDEIMSEHDIAKDGVISYSEFRLLFLDAEDKGHPTSSKCI
jgi:Ca2+-binding EF-hand superfamily protein